MPTWHLSVGHCRYRKISPLCEQPPTQFAQCQHGGKGAFLWDSISTEKNSNRRRKQGCIGQRSHKRRVWIKTDEMHPYTLLSSNRVSIKNVRAAGLGMYLVCCYSCVCTFWPYHPYLLSFILVCINTEGCGLVGSLWHAALRKHGQVFLCRSTQEIAVPQPCS